MANSAWKQQQREWKVARFQEKQERDAQREAEQRERAERNTLLKAHGYRWSKVQDVFGASDDGDSAAMVWQLYDAKNAPVSVKEALAAIEHGTAPVAAFVAYECNRNWHGKCRDRDCTCSCHQHHNN